MKRKENIYLRREKRKPYCTIIFISGEKLTQQEIKLIDKIGDSSEIFFIYREQCKINKYKLANLFDLFGYTTEPGNEGYSLLVVLKYMNTLEKFHGYFVMSVENLSEVSLNDFKIGSMGLKKAVFEVSRLDEDYLYEIYKSPKGLLDFSSKDLGSYSSHTTDNDLVYFPPLSIFDSVEAYKDFLSSFNGRNWKELLSSFFMKFENREFLLNQNIKNAVGGTK